MITMTTIKNDKYCDNRVFKAMITRIVSRVMTTIKIMIIKLMPTVMMMMMMMMMMTTKITAGKLAKNK